MADKESKNRPKQEPEPEGGPETRRQEFLEERLTPLRPRRTEEEGEAPTARPEKEQPGLPPDFRARRIGAYRARQEDQLKKKEREARSPSARPPGGGRKEPEDEPDTPGSAEPPQPPAPPPANNWIPIGPSVLRQGQGGTLPPTSGRVLGFAVGGGGDR